VQAEHAKRFRDVLRGMGRIYGQEPDAVTLDAYWIALRTWSLEDFEAAAARLMETAKFMPRPADFTELRKAGESGSGEAWAEVLQIARSGDYRNGVTHANPRVHAAVLAIGGYDTVGMSNTEFTHLLEKRFAEHYQDIGEREDIREALPQIAGSPRARLGGPQRLLGGQS
jgi:hypothetical protein